MEEGLCVPKEILEIVESDFESKKAAVANRWMRKLEDDYPNMPLEDRTEYTEFDSLRKEEGNEKALSEARKKAEEILSTWCGDNSDALAPDTEHAFGIEDEHPIGIEDEHLIKIEDEHPIGIEDEHLIKIEDEHPIR
ncbi:hypothetical protein GGR55DRAFT_680841 [Xylaria sp. FL0064]|nr:hypothetical protein GGR55DRAFT_680841 [Xylaria sp. FL0064]